MHDETTRYSVPDSIKKSLKIPKR